MQQKEASRIRGRLVAGAASAALLVVLPAAGRAEPLTLTWSDLVPKADQGKSPLAAAPSLTAYSFTRQAIVPGRAKKSQQPASDGVRQDLIGKAVRIVGFLMPLQTASAGALLVPYQGQCAHVPSCLPPPAANQAIDLPNLGDGGVDGPETPVWVTGTLSAVSLNTPIGAVDYQISDAQIEPYEE